MNESIPSMLQPPHAAKSCGFDCGSAEVSIWSFPLRVTLSSQSQHGCSVVIENSFDIARLQPGVVNIGDSTVIQFATFVRIV